MTLAFIDTHCHLVQYKNPLEIVASAQSVGVQRIIAVGMHVNNFEKSLELAAQDQATFPALGIHPEEVKDYPAIEAELSQWVEFIQGKASNLVAIAEIGLDHYFVKNKELWPLQERVFQQMLPIAESSNLPVSLHVKNAETRVLDLLESYNLPAAVIHWFSGPEGAFRRAIDCGYFFSIPQAIRYSPKVQKTVRETPVGQLLLESDGPAKFSGVVGEPKDCPFIATRIAEMRNIPPSELEQILEQNTRKAFPKAFP